MVSVPAQSAALFATGLMSRELGARRLGQVVAALAVMVSELPLFEGTEFRYPWFTYLWLPTDCLLADAVAQVGQSALVARHWRRNRRGQDDEIHHGIFVAGIVGGVPLTPARRYLKSPWLWYAAALAIFIFLPNMSWQAALKFGATKAKAEMPGCAWRKDYVAEVENARMGAWRFLSNSSPSGTVVSTSTIFCEATPSPYGLVKP
jgi:hypothetical protein